MPDTVLTRSGFGQSKPAPAPEENKARPTFGRQGPKPEEVSNEGFNRTGFGKKPVDEDKKED